MPLRDRVGSIMHGSCTKVPSGNPLMQFFSKGGGGGTRPRTGLRRILVLIVRLLSIGWSKVPQKVRRDFTDCPILSFLPIPP